MRVGAHGMEAGRGSWGARSLLTLAACVPPPIGTPEGQGCGKAATTGNLQSKVLYSGGVWRHYLLTIPADYQPDVKSSVVFDFHAYSQNSTNQAAYTQLDDKGAALGYIVVTPDAINSNWDINATSADFTFTADLMRTLDFTLCVDHDRLFATGMSPVLTSCRRSCASPTSGSMRLHPSPRSARRARTEPSSGCSTSRAPPTRSCSTTPSDRSRRVGQHATGADATPVEARIEPDIEQRTFVNCEPGLSATLYSIEGGGHTWPDATTDVGPPFGTTTHTINASDLILTFFAGQ